MIRRLILAAVAAATAVAGVVALGAPASAATFQTDGCQYVDIKVTTGSTGVIVLGPGCPLNGTISLSGSPTIVFAEGGTSTDVPLTWYQSVGRSGDSCEDGWTASYAEWPNGGKGGPTCDRSIEWGTMTVGEDGPDSVHVTINAPGDWAAILFDVAQAPFNQYVTGCNASGPSYYPTIIGNCPPI